MQNEIRFEIYKIYFHEHKNNKQIVGLQTQVEILKFESKKNASEERDNADQLWCQSTSSLHQDKALI